MGDFLTRQTTKPGYFMRSARSLGLMILLFISLLLISFDKIYAYSGPVHAGDIVSDYAKYKDTVPPASGGLPGNVSQDEFK